MDETNIDSTKKETNIGILLHSTSDFCLKEWDGGVEKWEDRKMEG